MGDGNFLSLPGDILPSVDRLYDYFSIAEPLALVHPGNLDSELSHFPFSRAFSPMLQCAVLHYLASSVCD
jgi:hypothetical protein